MKATPEQIKELLSQAVTERNKCEDLGMSTDRYLLGVYDTLQWIVYGADKPQIEEEEEE